MTHRFWVIIVAAFLTLPTVTPAQTLVQDTTSLVALAKPDGWIAATRPGFVSVRQEETDGRTRFLLSILVEDLVGPRVRIDQYKRIIYETHYEHYGAPQRWDERDTTMRGLPAYVADFSYPYGGDGEEVLVRRIVVFKERKAFLISGEAREEHWQSMLEYFNEALTSIELPQ